MSCNTFSLMYLQRNKSDSLLDFFISNIRHFRQFSTKACYWIASKPTNIINLSIKLSTSLPPFKERQIWWWGRVHSCIQFQFLTLQNYQNDVHLGRALPHHTKLSFTPQHCNKCLLCCSSLCRNQVDKDSAYSFFLSFWPCSTGARQSVNINNNHCFSVLGDNDRPTDRRSGEIHYCERRKRLDWGFQRGSVPNFFESKISS